MPKYTFEGIADGGSWPSVWVETFRSAGNTGSFYVEAGKGIIDISNNSGYTGIGNKDTTATYKDVYIDLDYTINTSNVTSGGYFATFLRRVDVNNQLWVECYEEADWRYIAIFEIVAGVRSTLFRSAGLAPFDVNLWKIKAHAVGSTVKAKTWKATDPEPAAWTAETTAAQIAEGSVGFDYYDGGTALPLLRVEIDNINIKTTPYLGIAKSDGATAFWQADISGTTLPDSIGTTNLAVTGTTALVDSLHSGSTKALEFTTDYATVAYAANPTQFSVEAWVKTTFLGFTPIIARDESASNKRWVLALDADGRPRFTAYDGIDANGYSREVIGAAAVNDGLVHHLVGVVDIVAGVGTVKLYVDGVVQGSTAIDSMYPTGNPRIDVGRRRTAVVDSIVLDDLAYYEGTALTEAQIQKHYKYTLISDWTDTLDSAKAGTGTGGVYDSGYLRLDATPDYLHYHNRDTGTKYELHGSEITVEFETEHYDIGTSGYEWWMELTQRKADNTGDTGNRIMLVVHGKKGRYAAVKQPGGDLSIPGQYQTYDPIADRFLRIREVAGTLYWDTSPDKVTWTNRTKVASPAWIAEGHFYVRLYSGNWKDFTVARPGYFNNLNLPYNGVGANNQLPWRTSTLFSKFVEAFDAALSTAVWNQYGTTVSGGILDIPVKPDYFFAKTIVRYQANNSIVGAEVTQYPNVADGTTQAYFDIVDSKDTGFRFLWQNNKLYLREVNANALVGTEVVLTYNTTDFKYLRFRESAGTMYWETSATGSEGSWVTRHSQVWTINPSNLYVMLFAGTWGNPAPADPGNFKVASVNIYPVPVGTDFLAAYHLFAIINQNFAAQYDTLVALGLEHSVPYNALVNANNDISTPYSVYQAIAKDNSLLWNLAAIIGQPIDTLYNVLGFVGSEQAALYNVHVAASSDIALLYGLYQVISSDNALLWNLSAIIGQPIDVVYDVLIKAATAANDINLSYNTNAIVAGDEVVPYDVLISLSKELSSLWNVTILAGQQTELLWAMRKAIAGDTYLRWQFEVFWYRLVEEAITWTQQNTPSDVWTPQNPKGKLWTPSI